MNGYSLIAKAYERGLTHHEIYKPLNQFYSTIRQFVDRPYFGVSAYDDEGEYWRPVHVNGINNPFPCRDRKGTKCHREFSKKDLLLHLAAEPDDFQQNFRFLVNSPKTQFHLIGFDIDGEDNPSVHELTCDLYHECFCDEWDYGGHVYIEKSRNRFGRYIWTIIERSSSPSEFNELCNYVSRAMRSRFKVDDDNKFDAIKGTLHYDDRDDVARLYADADGHPLDQNRGTLVTMPLAGAIARQSFEEELKAFLAFAKRIKGTKRYVNAIPESHLWVLLERIGPELAIELHGKRELANPASAATAFSNGGNTLCISAPQNEPPTKLSTCDKIKRKALSEPSGKNRMRLASSLHYYTLGSYAASPEALVAFYIDSGLSKGVETPSKAAKRLERAEEALAAHRNHPPKGMRFDKSYWMSLIKDLVKEEHRQDPLVKYRSPRTNRAMYIEDELLAAGLYVLTCSCFQPNDGDRKHSCSQEGQLSMYQKLTEKGLLTAEFKLKNKRVAIPVILQLAGLVVVRGGWCYRGRENGFGKRFGLGPNHPQFRHFVDQYGHLDVIPKAMNC